MKKSFWSKPVTWGGFAKFSILATLFCWIIAIIDVVCMFTNIPNKIASWFKKKFCKTRKETNYEDVE